MRKVWVNLVFFFFFLEVRIGSGPLYVKSAPSFFMKLGSFPTPQRPGCLEVEIQLSTLLNAASFRY